MTEEQQAIAYQLLRSVRSGSITAKDGATQLHRAIGLNHTSAQILVYVYQHMTRGGEYKRALSEADSEFLLDRIGDDDGPDGLTLALQAFERHIEYREAQIAQRGNRIILQRHQLRLLAMRADHLPGVVDLQTLNEEFSEEIRKSSRNSISARNGRLRIASTRPKTVIRTIVLFQRNPDVVAEVLYQAKGVCGGCGHEAPFNRRSDGSPYLEVHHKIPLSCGGDDTVENAVALCPNCHRHRHFGLLA